jgi:[amino group carrier protein]-lysine/ornithine hydrolase
VNEPNLDQPTRLLFDLVSTKSYSGEERNACDVFVAHAKDMGFETQIDEVNNAIAHRGACQQNEGLLQIVLLGHIDTVEGDIDVRIEDGVLHGRGAVDAKGPLCTMLVAASQANLPDGVSLTVIGAAGEEATGSIGARHILDSWSDRSTPDACIIGEPSGFDGVTLGYKGRLILHANAQVSNAHSAGNENSAPDELYEWWHQVRQHINAFNEGRTRVFDQIQATIQSTSSSNDGMQQSASFECGFRLPDGIDPHTLADQLQAFANENIHFISEGHERAHQTTRNDPLVRALSSSIRNHGNRPRPKLKTGTADLNVVGPIWNCPIAAYGPGDSDLDHTPIEHLHLDEYAKSIKILTTAIETLAYELQTNRTAVSVEEAQTS